MNSTTRERGFRTKATLLSAPVRRMVALGTSVERLDPRLLVRVRRDERVRLDHPGVAAGRRGQLQLANHTPPPGTPTTPLPASVPATRVGTRRPRQGPRALRPSRVEWSKSGTGWTAVLRSSRAPTCGGASLNMAAAREGMEGRCTMGRSPIEGLAPGPSIIAFHGHG